MIKVPIGKNQILQQTMDLVNSNEEIAALWEMTNTMAMARLGWSDHGPVHFQIVANGALRICRILAKHGAEFGIVRDYGLTEKHAEVVVVLASIFHDLGMSINRIGHEEYSLFMALKVLDDVLVFLPYEGEGHCAGRSATRDY